MIDRLILAIQIPVQGQWAIQVAQPLVRARPPAYCRLIVARTDMRQPRLAVISSPAYQAPLSTPVLSAGIAAPPYFL